MPDAAFRAGVKPGGLTNTTDVRVLVCYVLEAVGAPLPREELEQALLGEELVNYFDLAQSLQQLLESGLIQKLEKGYALAPDGAAAARTLEDTLPRTVREGAVRAAVMAQQFRKNKEEHKTRLEKEADGNYLVHGSIGDVAGPLFQFSLRMPDRLTAQQVQQSFEKNGDVFLQVMLACATENPAILEKGLQKLFGEKDK